ncbi:MAG: ArgE/DapE family deacylase [Alphaproteobacteria bacterium]|nr:ArgE/DapE family deacylase [Alphaproteobacteria bacterium]
MVDGKTVQALKNAVDEGFEEQIALTQALVRFASTRGSEQTAQDFMAAQMVRRGLAVDRFRINLDQIRYRPGFSPVHVSYENALNVVGTHRADAPTGRSLILNGHIDVVPAGPLEMWTTPPFEPRVTGDWLYGRGGGDMKAGLAACLAALDAIAKAGYQPAADVIVQSVVEEECTGNGALACLARGYRADAVIIPEPLNERLIRAQIGVIWFQVKVRGIPVHVAEATSGANAIEAAYRIITALRDLEDRWNARKINYPHYAHVDHPINLNVGKIEGGDWASSVPAWCNFDVRVSIFPGQEIADAKREIEQAVLDASRANVYLQNNPPEIVYHGFEAAGYILKDADEPAGVLERSHRAVFGTLLEEIASTATTDARIFGLYGDMPALVYGPKSEHIHGFDERVSLSSIRDVAKVLALFIAEWCGLVKTA